MFDAEDEEGVFSRVQTRGGGPVGEQRSAADAGGDRISPSMLRNWRALVRGGSGGSSATPSIVSPLPPPADQALEITRLRRELDRTRMERNVLKKSIAIFAEVLR